MSRHNRRQAIKLFTNHMNRIQLTAAKIAKEFDMNSVPVTTLKTITDKEILKPVSDMTSDNISYINHVNKVVKLIFQEGEAHAKKNGSKNVPVAYIKEMVRVVNNSYKEGVKENKTA